jgi:hypothetical protein
MVYGAQPPVAHHTMGLLAEDQPPRGFQSDDEDESAARIVQLKKIIVGHQIHEAALRRYLISTYAAFVVLFTCLLVEAHSPGMLEGFVSADGVFTVVSHTAVALLARMFK